MYILRAHKSQWHDTGVFILLMNQCQLQERVCNPPSPLSSLLPTHHVLIL